MEFLYEVASSLHGASCGEQVVVEEDDVVLVDGVAVDLDGVLAILLSVALLNGVARQLARLAAENDAGTKLQGECR